MPRFVTGTVTAILSERPGLQRVEVDGRRAYVLTALIGPVDVGDRVVVNTTALDLDLGTGGWDVVHWNLRREQWDEPGGGHVLKLRYTSLQVDTGVVEEAEPVAPDVPLAGVPVVACLLHSQLAAVAVACRELRPAARVAYVMTDGASLPLALSDLVADLVERGLVDTTVTAGQAFGGDHEAVNVLSAIEHARRVAGADVVVVGAGPGGVGTATAHGFSALEMAGVLDVAGRAGAAPIVAVRYSDADGRARHRGVSHHTTAVLALTHEPVTVPIPRGRAGPSIGAHRLLEVDVPDIGELFHARGLRVETMGRVPDDDPGFFAYAAAAGVAAAALVSG